MMKKFNSILVIFAFLTLPTAIALGAADDDCKCTISSTASENIGKCKAKVGGGGDACVSVACWLEGCNCDGDTCSSES